MTKAELAKKISKDTGLETVTALVFIDSFTKNVKETLRGGENVYLRGFGTFEVKHRAAKKARIITRRTTIDLPERNVPHFKPSKAFSIKG